MVRGFWLLLLLPILAFNAAAAPLTDDAFHQRIAIEPTIASGPLTRTHTLHLPLLGRDFYPHPPPLLLSALYYDTTLTNEPDEAFQIYNPFNRAVALEGWRLTDGRRSLVFPAGISVSAGGWLWCARRAVSFTFSFGATPDCEYNADTDPAVPNLIGTGWQFPNTGGNVSLVSPTGSYSDTLVYEGGNTAVGGWVGPAVYPYRPTSSFSEEGQILYRKLDQRTGRPVPDTDTRADWAQDPSDLLDGRRARYAGWRLEQFSRPPVVTEPANVQVILTPDNGFDALYGHLAAAQHSIRFEGYTFDNARLGELLAAKARAGVAVEMLLDGSPPGGVSDQQRWIVAQVAAAGGQVYYLRSNPATGIRKRYAYQHGKFWLLDGAIALIGSENPGPEAFPDDPKADGTFGRRGVYVATDAPSVVAGLSAFMAADIAAGVYGDIWPWDAADPALGAPSAGFVPSYASGGIFYPVQKTQPLAVFGIFPFQLLSSPEAALRNVDGLLGLIGQAGRGDTILVEQLYEHLYWGPESSSVAADPNPRLEAYLAAARRGARVRVLLDAYFDNSNLNSPRSNLRTVEYLQAVAQAEGLDLDARRRNPTGQGIHNKMVLAQISGRGWAVIGSLNGSEGSHKLNREMTLLIGSDAVYAYLADVFWYDWDVTP